MPNGPGKREIVTPKARVDFGFRLVGQDNLDAIEEMASAGVIGFKFFLHQAIEGVAPCDDGALLEAFERIARTGLRAAVHAENSHIIGRKSRALRQAGRHDATANLDARPTVSESEMVERCVAFARSAGTKLHICHATAGRRSPSWPRQRRRPRRHGGDGAEWLSSPGRRRPAWNLLMFPRPSGSTRIVRRSGRTAQRRGRQIATDHAPRHEHEKILQLVWDTKSGFIGVETTFPLMTAVQEGRLEIVRYARALSENPARAYGCGRARAACVSAPTRTSPSFRPADAGAGANDLHSRLRVTPSWARR